MNLKPFFCFYGGKWRAAPRYPKPEYDTIIEPFAGAAGYSMRYPEHKVILVEKDPVIALLWRYLISATPEEIRAIPLIRSDQTVADLGVSPAQAALIGFWLNKGARPALSPGAWMRQGKHVTSFWGEAIRERVASQVEYISHWSVIEGNCTLAPDFEATWFIDPPYQNAGLLYKYGAKGIDFGHLAQWCKTRRGQVMVCENVGATWLPFEPYLNIKSMEGVRGKAVSAEALWRNNES